tara:strand:+ start:261 stop:578 length:318 start_codon:yes stop_codon:yes gene_type:complete
MFSSHNESIETLTEDASSLFKLVEEVRFNEHTEKEINRESRYVSVNDNPQPVDRREAIGGLDENGVPVVVRTTITVSDLPDNTITKKITNRIMDNIIVSSVSKLY